MRGTPITVGMNEVNISTQEQPIIGTQSLGPCVGVLIYSKKLKRAVVLHISTEWKDLLLQCFMVLADNKLISDENYHKAIKNLYLHEKYSLYDIDLTTKRKMITKSGLNITDAEDTLEVTIIPGYYKDNYNVAINITKFLMTLEPLVKVQRDILPKTAVRTVMIKDLGSREFYFNASTGKFVTTQIKNNTSTSAYRL